MTKPLHEDALKCPIEVEGIKVEVAPKIIDNAMVIGSPHITPKPQSKIKPRIAKAKMSPKKSHIEKVTSHLYDLEDNCGPEKSLNIDFGLYQMENY